ncbi:phage portal protein [Curtobacterium sp. DN_7.5]|uniref:phage portal protein n=1 Tax=Curtobacterium sp. DN_7.5 TaxID=3049047 RepID=UPI001F564AE8|nr:phage portal protein [Curtobacterium sp. DN_7.5]
MTETLRVNALSDDENDIVNELLTQLDEKTYRNLRRAAIYDGKRATSQVGGVIPPQYQKLGLVLGWCAKGVDGLARRCNIDRFAWTGGDLDSIGMQDLEDSTFLLSELSQARTDSLVHGVSYLVTTRGGDGEPDVLVTARDGLNATGMWNPRTRMLDSFISVTSRDLNGSNTVTGFALYLPDLVINAWQEDGWWQVERSEHTFGVPVEPQIYKPRAGRRMGRSRMTRPAISHQEAAIRAMMRLEAHMDIYAIPKMVLLGGSDSMFKNEDGTYKSSWQVAMGRIFGIPDDDDTDPELGRPDVKQFAAESPQPHLAQLNALAKLEAREFDLPDQDFALTDMANPTSEGSYVQGRDALLAEAEGAMSDWGIGIRRTVARALAMKNGLTEVPKAYNTIVPDWRNPLYLSKAAQADAGSKQISAVSWLGETRVGLKLLGLSEPDIKEALAEKQRIQGRAVIAALANRTPTSGNAE